MMNKGNPRNSGPVKKPKNFKGTLKRLWHYFGPEKIRLIFLLSLIIIDTLILIFIPFLIGRAIDLIDKVEGVNFNALGLIVIILMLSYLIDALINFFQNFVMAGVSQRIVFSFRRALMEKLQKLPIVFFDSTTHGEIMSRLTNDIDNISTTISQSTTQLMAGIITVIGAIAMMLYISPILTAASIITIPMIFALTRAVTKKTSHLFREQQKELGILNGHIEESISGIQVVKAFNHEDKSIKELEVINNRLCEVGIKALIFSGFLMPIMNVINNIGFTVVAGLGGILALKAMITIGTITSFIIYSKQFSRPLNDFANIYNTLQSAIAGAERVFEILDDKEEALDSSLAIDLNNPKGHVVFEGVDFGYRSDLKILKDINFEAPAGSNIALVGPTGAGKTTIVNLLARFYDVTSGKITIDGTDIRSYTRDSLRKCFGIVLQDTYLFSGTIRDNIKYGKLNATEEEIIAASKMANAHVFIERLPQGYDTILSESGNNLSQGQRQLLAIGRAILADPSILILDEATSSVDTRTELNIQEGMLKLMEGRTSFVIAHRLSTIRDADMIIVIDKGQILEKGNHHSLLLKKGFYYNMYNNQYKNIGEN
ncbi:MAG TPA: ABC transporter ATP-binding protein [Clostridiaceae bacterium]